MPRPQHGSTLAQGASAQERAVNNSPPPQKRRTNPELKVVNVDQDEIIGKLQERIAQLELDLQISNLGKDDDEESAGVANANAAKERAEAQAAHWQKKWEARQTELDHFKLLNQRQSKSLKNIEGMNASFREWEKEKEKEIVALKIKTGEISGLESRLQQLDAEKSRLVERLAETEKIAQEKTTRVAELAEKISNDQECIGVLEQSAQRAIDLEFKVTRLEKEKANLETQLSEEMVRLEQNNVELKEQLNKALNVERNGDDELVRLATEEVAGLQTQVKELIQDKKELEVDNKLLKAEAAEQTAYMDYIDSVETKAEELDEKLASAVSEGRSKEAMVVHLQTQVEELQERNEHLSNEVEELQIWREVGALPTPITSRVDHAISGKTLAAEGLRSAKTSALDSSRIEPVSSDDTIMLEADAASSMSVAQSATIIINIDPGDRGNWTWLQKMRAAIPKNASLDINGPPDLVTGLNEMMEQHRTDYLEKTKKAIFLESQIAELERRPACAEPGHKQMHDTLDAQAAHIEMNDLMLSQYVQRIKALEDEKAKLEVKNRESIRTKF